MMEKRRGRVCPNCGYMTAVSGKYVICLSPACKWQVIAKRKDDGELPDFNKLKTEYNG